MAKTLRVKPKPRNRKAQEATLINIDALKVRVARIERFLAEQFGALWTSSGKETGYFAHPGKGATKVHFVSKGKPMCGVRIGAQGILHLRRGV